MVGDVRTNAFPKTLRVRTSAEFRRIYENGSKRVSRCFVLFALSNEMEYSRIGLTTPRKLGKAHERNRLKRQLREIFRTAHQRMPKGFDFVVNPRRSASGRSFDELRGELISLLEATVK